MPDISPDTVQRMWLTTLIVYAVVLGVVAVLLALVLRAAREVRTEVSTIWTIGQQVANNTIHIALLGTTNHIAAEILASAKGIVTATAAMGAHAAQCPGCPGCVLDTEPTR